MSTASPARIAADQARRATSSVARVEANRRNGLKSTGPRTAEGKTRVSANALKHGLRSERSPLDFATDSALSIEREEFQATLEAFTGDLDPHGPIETRMVERLAQIDLRLQRAVRLETTHLENKFQETLADATKAGSPVATDTGRTRDNWLLMFAFLRDPAALKLISQYESRLARDFARTLSELRKTQKLREQSQLHDAQESCEQTHPLTALTAGRSAASDRGVGPANTHEIPPTTNPSQEIAKQTQPAPHPIAKLPLNEDPNQPVAPAELRPATPARAHSRI